MENYEKEIQFRLVKAKGPLVKGDKYHARIVDNGPIDAIAEVCEQHATFTRTTLQYYVGNVFEHMLRGVVTDGRSRRFGDLFEISASIRGGFDRIDEEFDRERHKFVIDLHPCKEFKAYKRKTDPENVQKRPRGRIDYVTSPGCEKGEIRFGQDVIIYGKDLTLSYGDSVEIHTPNGQTYGHLFNLRNGEPVVWSDGHIESNDAFVEYDDNHIRFKWFQAIKKEDVVGKTVPVRFRPWARDPERTARLKNTDRMGSVTTVRVLP